MSARAHATEPSTPLQLLASPTPRQREHAYAEYTYPRSGGAHYLPVPVGDGASSDSTSELYFEVLRRRHTQTPLGMPSEAHLATLLWSIARVHTERSPDAGRWQHRGTPSAGGRHPIDLVIIGWVDQNTPVLYEPRSHALLSLVPVQRRTVRHLAKIASDCVPGHAGLVIWHVAQPARTRSKYQHAESLIWRDAGALVATTALTCAALGLACTPLGATGEPWLSKHFEGRAYGVGGCVIGVGISAPQSAVFDAPEKRCSVATDST